MRKYELATSALDIACETREEAGLDLDSPINIFDLCDKLTTKVRVQFVGFSMEACYIRSARPLIMVSALRPLGRRAFNCAHELGHHVFGHGSTIDQLQDESAAFKQGNPKEYLADTYAGFLLMPKLGIRRAFTRRGWKLSRLTPTQVYLVACEFGVGYTTLVNHLAYGLREISAFRANELSKIKLPKIRESILGDFNSKRLLLVDEAYGINTVDIETGSHVLLPQGSEIETTNLKLVARIASGDLYLAKSPGLCRASTDSWAAIVRVSRYRYAGWSSN